VKKSQTEILDGNPTKLQFMQKRKRKRSASTQSKGPAWLMIHVREVSFVVSSITIVQ